MSSATHPEHGLEETTLERVHAGLTHELSSLREPATAGADRHANTSINILQSKRAAEIGAALRRVLIGRIDVDGMEKPVYIGPVRYSADNIIVASWRAPIASKFYQAKPQRPGGVLLRRHLSVEGRRLLAIQDEILLGPGAPPPLALPESPATKPLERASVEVDAGMSAAANEVRQPPGSGQSKPTPPSSIQELQPQPAPRDSTPSHDRGDDGFTPAPVGPSLDILIADLERERQAEMGDIIATIQADQHRLITEPLPGALVIQGGPGTGKTAVALHRAAWLLFTYQEELARSGVLVVGPNRAFMDYVAQVLPSLGEHSVIQLPIHRVSASAPRPVAFEWAAVQRLKGDPRWRKLIREAIYRRHRRPGSDVGVDIEHPRAAFDDRPPAVERVVVSPDLVAKVRTALLKERRPHNRARERFRGMIETQAYEAYLRHRTSNLPPLQLDVFLRALGAQRGWTDRIRRWWPELDAKQLIGDLLADDAALATAGKELFSTTDLQLLHRAPDDQGRQPWTDSDLPLVDEANAQLNGRDKAYGYVIVDEAQDLTPMQLRMVARRTTNGAMTLVGDIAQATGPWRYEHWSEIVDHLPKGVTARIAELTIGFRVPAQVMELATKLLPRIAPGLTAPRAVRQGASDPRLVRSGEDIGEAVCAEVAEAVQKRPGKIGVIVPDALQADIEAHLGSAGIVVGEITRDGLKRQITVLGSSRAKGLEFDTVVVVEPARIEQDARHGTSELYVALTRATQHLSIVYTQALPEGLPQDAAEPPAQPHEQPAVGLPELTGRFTEALIFAKMLHGSQRRRGTAVPFMSHLMAVASLVLEDGGSEDEAVAALLHDAAEDHGGAAVIERVGAQFGEHVAAIVAAVSDPLDADPSTPWRILKEEHLIRLETGSNAARRVALAEKVDNAEAVLRGHRNFGDEIWARLGIDRDDLLWYYRALADLFIREHPGGLARELDALVSDLETRCSPERPPAPRTEDIDTTQAVPL